MTTKSCTISIFKKDQTIETVFCSGSGEIEHTGILLMLYYNGARKIKKLLSMGGLLFLDKNIDPSPEKEHTYKNPQKDVCLFAQRDIGISRHKTEIYDGCYDYVKSLVRQDRGFPIPFNYIFNEELKKWFVLDARIFEAKKTCRINKAVEKYQPFPLKFMIEAVVDDFNDELFQEYIAKEKEKKIKREYTYLKSRMTSNQTKQKTFKV